jgi:acyl carrier protein
MKRFATMDDAYRVLDEVLSLHLDGIPPGSGIPDDASFVDLGLTSIRAISLVSDLEETFELEFPDEMLSEATFATRGSLAAVLTALYETASDGG